MFLRLPLFLALIFVTAVLVSGFVEPTRICGSLEIEQIYCFVPPCPRPVRLHYLSPTNAMESVVLTIKDELLKTKIESLPLNRRFDVCVTGHRLKNDKTKGAAAGFVATKIDW